MAKVSCNECGKLMDSRSMSTCSRCYSYICPDCMRDSTGNACSACSETSHFQL